MIINKKPITIAEVYEITKDNGEKTPLKDYLKTYNKLKFEKAKKLEEEIKKLNNQKIKEEDVVKIVDFLPKTAEELNKLLKENNLNEEETNSILSIISKY